MNRFLRGYWFYLRDRFPPLLNGTAIFLFYNCTYFASCSILDLPVILDVDYVMGAVLFLLFFYHLRVFDDQKDKEKDVKAYPDRALSRGIVTYGQLWITGGVAIGLEFGIALYLGNPIFGLYLVCLFYSWLMYKEFFVTEWLNKHLFLYGVSHMFILAILDFTILQIPVSGTALQHHVGLLLFAFLGFFMTFSLEVARKIRVPSDESPEVDSYSKVLGVKNALVLVPVFQAVVMLLAYFLRELLHLSVYFYGLTTAVWALVVFLLILSIKNLTADKTKKLDKIASLFYLAFYVSLAVHLYLNKKADVTFALNF